MSGGAGPNFVEDTFATDRPMRLKGVRALQQDDPWRSAPDSFLDHRVGTRDVSCSSLSTVSGHDSSPELLAPFTNEKASQGVKRATAERRQTRRRLERVYRMTSLRLVSLPAEIGNHSGLVDCFGCRAQALDKKSAAGGRAGPRVALSSQKPPALSPLPQQRVAGDLRATPLERVG